MKIKVFWAWYDFWIGAFWDREARILYICPVPTLGIAIHMGRQNNTDMLI